MMICSNMAGTRRLRFAAVAGAVALSTVSCAQGGPGETTDRAANMLADPIERMIAMSEWKAAETRELAGREPIRSGRNVQDVRTVHNHLVVAEDS